MQHPAPPESAVIAAMSRALELAQRGPSWGVNPQVGAVILDPQHNIIGEGWHRGAGTPHAEVEALKDALANLATNPPVGLDPASHPGATAVTLPPGCTAVVTLEPCNHFGKTPPCAQALRAAGISRVTFATADPGQHSGGGAATLRAAGVTVEGGILGEQGAALLRPWTTATKLGRPYVTLKWAASLDGRTAADDGSSKWISGPESRADSHRRRATQCAVLAGTGTIIADDAELTARHPDGTYYEHQPLRVVLGRRELPANLRIFNDAAETIQIRSNDLPQALAELYDLGIRRLWVEGGPTVASAFARAGLVDEVLVYTAPLLLGGSRHSLQDIGVHNLEHALHLEVLEHQTLGRDTLVRAAVTNRADPTQAKTGGSPAGASYPMNETQQIGA